MQPQAGALSARWGTPRARSRKQALAAPAPGLLQEHAAEFGTDTQLGGYRSTMGKR